LRLKSGRKTDKRANSIPFAFALKEIFMFPETLKFILTLQQRQPSLVMAKALDPLFLRLQDCSVEEDAQEIETLIWELWTRHIDSDADKMMRHAINCITNRDLTVGEELLSNLIQSHPQWAEAWNKRASLRFLAENYNGAVQDIQSVLALEPRHFRALSGFGQICYRLGEKDMAVTAFDAALRINPFMTGIRVTADKLRDQDCGDHILN